jgi:hypothetical protein
MKLQNPYFLTHLFIQQRPASLWSSTSMTEFISGKITDWRHWSGWVQVAHMHMGGMQGSLVSLLASKAVGGTSGSTGPANPISVSALGTTGHAAAVLGGHGQWPQADLVLKLIDHWMVVSSWSVIVHWLTVTKLKKQNKQAFQICKVSLIEKRS